MEERREGRKERRKDRSRNVRKEEMPHILLINETEYDPVSISLFTINSILTFITPLERQKSRDKIMEFYFPMKRINNGNSKKS